ncbi:helix-turn-helix domain-containing protein [Mycobacterium asiaticum]|uniref:Resolvase HTH domain-containing protein n=1 Tax=Mycobacterium asiaticum TaxID=1790 RepID=A0A1A3KQ45_MYCAS|nr:helix-turn-helix domain-containing protein [Mycobacterium asiaticum]OBJ86498.1 hypothetical protein A5640_11070 [Mycobacterium asiaticum]
MDSGKRSTITLTTTTKKVGGGSITPTRLPPIPIKRPEPQPVNLDAGPGSPRKPDTVENSLAYAAQLRAQAAKLIQRAAQIEAAAAATTPGADGRHRPTWDRFNNPETEQQVHELRAAGQSVRDIAETLGCSRGTAHRIIRKLGA